MRNGTDGHKDPDWRCVPRRASGFSLGTKPSRESEALPQRHTSFKSRTLAER